MNDPYMKNFGIWLGAPLAGLFLLGFLFRIDLQVHWLILLAGIILAIIKTHQEIGGRIQFGKAIGPMLLMVGGIFILTFIMRVLFRGMPSMWYFIEYMFLDLLFELIVATSILLAAGQWYMFEKAGKPGWASIIPIYNLIIICEIAKRPTWWVAMIIVPVANIVFMVKIYDGLAKSFGKDSGFTVGLVFLSQVFAAILGYGDAVYLETPSGGSVQDNPDLLDTDLLDS